MQFLLNDRVCQNVCIIEASMFTFRLSANKVSVFWQARHIAVPTDDAEVKVKLRSMNEPICFFGEGPADRRERLRDLLSRLGEIQAKQEEQQKKEETKKKEQVILSLVIEAVYSVLYSKWPVFDFRIFWKIFKTCFWRCVIYTAKLVKLQVSEAALLKLSALAAVNGCSQNSANVCSDLTANVYSGPTAEVFISLNKFQGLWCRPTRFDFWITKTILKAFRNFHDQGRPSACENGTFQVVTNLAVF